MTFDEPLPYQTPLDAATLTRIGLPGWPMGIAGRVLFSDLDPLSHVNNTVYFRWFEGIRVSYLRDWGLSRYCDPANEPRIVVRSTECHFRREIGYDEEYVVTTRTTRFRSSSFTMDYAIHAPDLRATGSAVVVLLTPDGKSKLAIPDAVRARFRAVDGATAE
jgi:acyl-CoA thioester hydrolase